MIDRFQLIRNIGQFDSFAAGPGIDLAPLTLIYAENGRGKTTLSAILRSLASGEPVYINERRRLGSVHPAHVVLQLDAGRATAIFQNSRWSMTYPNILIFDDHFVHENVHSGLMVEAGHRQNLHELIIGRVGAALGRQVEQLTEEIATLQGAVREKAQRITPDLRGTLSVDQFCSLPEVPDIDAALDAAERRVLALQEADSIRSTAQFEAFALPYVDISALEQLLARALPELDAAAAAAVQAHFSSLGEASEGWVSQGVRHLAPPGSAGSCPFCGQGLDQSTLVEHYRAYFGQAYSDHKRNIASTRSSLLRDLAGDALAKFQRYVEVARDRRRFWSRFLEIPDINLDMEGIARVWQQTRDALAGCLDQKIAAPLEKIGFGPETKANLDTYLQVSGEILSVSRALQDCNPVISRLKIDTAAGDLGVALADRSSLIATKARFSGETLPRCEEYLTSKREKDQAEERKAEARQRLDRHREQVVPRYQSAINELLRKFYADFRIIEVQAVNPRGIPSSTYCVEINSHRIPVTGGEAPPGSPAFRNTLSSGDRNTLALAFFFAWLGQEQDLSSAVVVIDDPVSSLDEARIMATVQEIRNLVGRAHQVTLLSHSKQLLCSVWQHADQTRCATLEIRRSASGSTITPWNIHEAAITEYDRRHALLRSYDRGTVTDARQVAESLRPVLEGFLRVAYPEHFPPGTLLGNLIDRARQSLTGQAPILSETDLRELEEIKEYANRFQHDSNPAWDVDVTNINETQLLGFVRRVLAFTKR